LSGRRVFLCLGLLGCICIWNLVKSLESRNGRKNFKKRQVSLMSGSVFCFSFCNTNASRGENKIFGFSML
jgi:hypothetical protein